MVVSNLAELKARVPKGRRLMGLDLGTKTIGLALSDVSLTIATPFDTLKRGKFSADVERLRKIFEDQQVAGLVLGLPVSMDGREGPRAQSTRQFAANLLEKIDLPIAFWDERLSTATVERMLIEEADMSRRRRAEVVDKLAASAILQNFLDYLHRRP